MICHEVPPLGDVQIARPSTRPHRISAPGVLSCNIEKWIMGFFSSIEYNLDYDSRSLYGIGNLGTVSTAIA
jgi:hypothetical protein